MTWSIKVETPTTPTPPEKPKETWLLIILLFLGLAFLFSKKS